MRKVRLTIYWAVLCLMAVANFVSAETIRGINMDFVDIGNAGNGTDPATGNLYGAVSSNYRIGKYEVTNTQWNAFTTAIGAPTSNAYFTGAQQPTNVVSWYEAAQFCNYLTSGNKYSGAYNFDMSGNFLGIDRVSSISTYGTTYVIPTEDEWYKAAYFKSDGSGYSLYANGTNTIPPADNGWNYAGGAYSTPWNVGTGTMEQNGTFDMMGNVWEWNETFIISGSTRGLRGGAYESPNYGESINLGSYGRNHYYPYNEFDFLGFRVASIPEPATLLLLGLGGMLLRKRNGAKIVD